MSTSSTENEEIKPFQGHGPNEEAILTQRRNTNDDEVIDTNSILSRRESQLIMNTESVYQTASTSLKPLPPMGDGRPYPPMLPSRQPYEVCFNGPDDPDHPYNFPLWKKLLYGISVVIAPLSVSLGSAMFSQGTEQIMETYHVGWTVASLGTSLFIFGFASGPVFWGPLSELFGRKIIMILSGFLYECFSFAVATGKDIQTIIICRFFAGFLGSASYVVSPAILADMFNSKSRGRAITVFSMVLFGGPMLGPIFGGFTVKNSSLGWRWTSYFCGIIGALSLVMNAFVLEETHHPLILVGRAEDLRRRTGNWGIYAAHEEVKLSIREIIENNVARPLKMLVTEPILFFASLYNGFVYAILYCCLTAIPTVFEGRYHFSMGVAELPYLSMLIGEIIGAGIVTLYDIKFQRIAREQGKLDPEAKLQPLIIGGFSFIIGLFWFGWCGDYAEHVHWIVPTIAVAFIGNGLITIFLPCFNYIIDCFLVVSASAMAANTFVRSCLACAFPLFSRQMFNNLTIKWAITLLGCLGALLLPVPFFFLKYGKKLRQKSKYAFVE